MRESIYLRLSNAADQPLQWVIRPTMDHSSISPVVSSGTWDEALAQCKDRRIVALAPAEHCLLLTSNLPVRQQQKLLQAIPYALEDQLADDVDALHFAIGARLSNGDVPAVVIARKLIDFWLNQFSAAELEPDRLYAETLCLPSSEKNQPALKSALVDGERIIVRHANHDGFASSLSEFLEFFSPEQLELDSASELQLFASSSEAEVLKEKAWPIQLQSRSEPAMSLLARHSESRANINLLQGNYSSSSGLAGILQPLKVSAALAVAAVLLMTLNQFLENNKLEQRLNQVTQAVEDDFKATFPGLTRIVDLERQASSELAKLRSGGQAGNALVELLSDTSAALKNNSNIELRSIQLRDGELFMSLQAKALTDLEKLRAQLRKLENIRHEVQSANSSDAGVQIRLLIARNTGEKA